MPYLLSGELEQLRKSVKNFAREVVAPVSAHHDATKSFPYKVVQQMAATGYWVDHFALRSNNSAGSISPSLSRLRRRFGIEEAQTHVLVHYDAGMRQTSGVPFKRQASVAKLVSSKLALDNARDSKQTQGDYGFMNEWLVAGHCRD